MKIAATICSRSKRSDASLLPARDRYTGEHVQRTATIADEFKTPFYILSGKYGLIEANTEIPTYDYYLEQEQVASLAKIIEAQIAKDSITKINFYTEDKESWAPYIEAMHKGAALAGVTLEMHTL